MQKKQYWNVKTLVFMALLIAMHLVLTRVLVIDLGAYRISVGSVCTILAGLWLGPVAGGVCGLCADIIGCFMKGYAVNPFITVAAILWGVIPALAKPLFANKKKTGKTVGICVSIVVTAVLSSLGRSSCSCKTVICKQEENRKDSWHLRIYRSNSGSQLSGIYNSRTCNYAWI